MQPTRKTLPQNAYRPLERGEQYIPFVPPTERPPEASGRAIAWGLLMAAVFTAAAAYLGLKIGQVFEAAIPIAILAVGLAGLYARRNTVLENVIIQSIGAASGVIVAGAIFTIPALYILNLNANFFQIFLASLFGGFLGILFLIPLRRYFVAEQHGHLPFPEATATTEVLVTGESGGAQAVVLLIAAAVGGIYDFLVATFGMWAEVISTRLVPWGTAVAEKAKLVLKLNTGAAVMGLGYIIGLRYASIICAGSFVSWLVLIPLTWFFGQHLGETLLPGTVPIGQMSAEQIFTSYIRHIGIGGIACAGIIGIIKNFKIIAQAFSLGLKEIFAGKGRSSADQAVRTDRDIPMSVLLVLIGAVTVCILLFFRGWVVSSLFHAVAALLLALIIAFLFTTVAARATAIVGVNPVSGMTLMTLIVSSVILVKLGLSGTSGMLSALIIGTVVCTALSTAGGFITDLKIGYWLGSTPFNQERLKFMGVLVASLAVGGVVLLLARVYGFVPSAEHPSPMAAPQANAMAAVLNVLFTSSQVPWGLYGAGVFMALTLEMIGVPPLAFALGMYLPIELNTPLLVGGLLAHWVGTRSKDKALNDARRDKGTLIASGFIAGGSIMGVVSAFVALVAGDRLHVGLAEATAGNWHVGMIVSLFAYLALCLFLYRYAKSARVQE
ncbi:MAG: OPT family oligopeptide transporter [Candidatus Oleimicrobiaceae bacterium]